MNRRQDMVLSFPVQQESITPIAPAAKRVPGSGRDGRYQSTPAKAERPQCGGLEKQFLRLLCPE
jgi:hypothetical protein